MEQFVRYIAHKTQLKMKAFFHQNGLMCRRQHVLYILKYFLKLTAETSENSWISFVFLAQTWDIIFYLSFWSRKLIERYNMWRTFEVCSQSSIWKLFVIFLYTFSHLMCILSSEIQVVALDSIAVCLSTYSG